jgi:hypothetical protein
MLEEHWLEAGFEVLLAILIMKYGESRGSVDGR